MRLRSEHANQWMDVILYVGAMLLMLEWIYPLEQVTDTGNAQIFFIFVVYCFLLTLIYIPTWLTVILKLFGVFFVMHALFYDLPLLSLEWIGLVFEDIRGNIGELWGQNWDALTPSFRTLLFLVLLWMLSYLLYYWFVIVKRPFPFVLLTIVYITLLDTFTAMDGTNGIIRTFVISIIILGLANLHRIIDRERLNVPVLNSVTKWLAPILAVVIISAGIGYAAPKYDPQWPDPVPFLEGAAESSFGAGGGGAGTNRVGYGVNDEQLGGGFTADPTTVFYAEVNNSHYWKVETKDVYTGKGWVRSSDEYQYTGADANISGLEYYGESVEFNSRETTLKFENPGNLDKIPYLYGTIQIVPEGNVTHEYSSRTGELFSLFEGERVVASEPYYMYSDFPSFPQNAMREVPTSSETEQDSPYLNNPDSLPDRVGELAEEIVADVDDNRYDQAMAIEEYFENGDFVYETEDVPRPEEDEDYVDQFLFETQRGYCDNFSTSMVVLLRELDIPARWVKGFTGGESAPDQDALPDAGSNVYEIQNNNAHSWVEVYFDDVGWVPFEPTIGFSNEASISTGEDVDDLMDGETDDTLDASDESEAPEPDQGEETEDTDADDSTGVGSGSDGGLSILQWIGIVLVILVTTFVVLKYRMHIVRKYRERQLKRDRQLESFPKAYDTLIRALNKKGLYHESGQTLGEFAKKVDRRLGNGDMTKMTRIYERYVYREEDVRASHEEVVELWNKLMDKIFSERS
ncbi:DUF4129 domain-containing transglutaminase family protein [Halalkalibacillus halophilus]|uniref:DUF4129 domain-containing transglutaminase family protein n=1 Tax=Halalkalibacillus halophilus TaxID=392827 RepID=UPI0003F749CF|nr:DUF4129 domain-containing transglutaminase family protein [Halalkalibacillus halophilus]